jgi:hypothetical protein
MVFLDTHTLKLKKYIVSIWMQLKFFAFHKSSNIVYGIKDLEALTKQKKY